MAELTKVYKLQTQKIVNGKLYYDKILSVHSSKEFLLSIMRDLQRIMEEDPTIFYSVVWYQSVDISHLLQSL